VVLVSLVTVAMPPEPPVSLLAAVPVVVLPELDSPVEALVSVMLPFSEQATRASAPRQIKRTRTGRTGPGFMATV
jgi:hypothetical protein